MANICHPVFWRLFKENLILCLDAFYNFRLYCSCRQIDEWRNKSMNKKLLGVMGISGAILLGSVYSISANTSGYELYKSALKQTHEADSATMNIDFKLEDNNQSLMTSSILYKADMKNQVSTMTSEIANDEESNKMNMYKQDGSWYVEKDGIDSIYKMEVSKNPHHKNTAELKDDMEKLVDVMTKNLQQQITVAEKNGTHSIDLDLTGKEIPLSVNALSSLMIKHAAMSQDGSDQESSGFHIKPTIPEIDHDITVKQIKIAADVNKENYVEKQTVKVVVTGKDSNGKSHELVLNFAMKVSDYNKTSVTPVEIPVENVVEFDHSTGGHK
jgi:hypothetical protein